MSRRVEPLSQVELVVRLREAIDASADRRVRALLTKNPYSSWSTHVQYNLGEHRREWLRTRGYSEPVAISLQRTRTRRRKILRALLQDEWNDDPL